MHSAIKLILLMMISSFSFAADPSCLDAKFAKTMSNTFVIETSDSNQIDLCNPDSHYYKIIETLSVIKNIKFNAGKLAPPLNQKILPTDFWTFFKKRAKKIMDEDAGARRCEGDQVIAFVFPAEHDGVMHLCPAFYKDTRTVYDRISTLMHEMRHFDDFYHVTCTRGPEAGIVSCDESIKEHGAYAVTVEVTTKLALLGKNIPAPARAMLKFAALTRVNDSFNDVVLPNGFTAVYAADETQGYIYDGKSMMKAPLLPTNGKLISRGTSMIFFPHDKSDAYAIDSMSKDFGPMTVTGKSVTTYNTTPREERPDIADLMNGDYVVCSLKNNKINCPVVSKPMTKNAQTELPFKGETIYESTELGLNDKNAVYVRSDQDELYRLELGKVKMPIQKVENYAAGFKSLLMFNGERMGLTNEGAVQVFKDNVWTESPAFAGKRFNTLTRPFYWTEYFMN